MKRALASVAALVALSASTAATAAPVPIGGVAESPVPTPVPPAAGASAQPVRVLSRAPLTLHVAKRQAGERVRVVVTVQGRVFTRVVVARADGTATLTLADVLLRRCQPVYVRLGSVTRGAATARLQVVRWPSLDCAPTT